MKDNVTYCPQYQEAVTRIRESLNGKEHILCKFGLILDEPEKICHCENVIVVINFGEENILVYACEKIISSYFFFSLNKCRKMKDCPYLFNASFRVSPEELLPIQHKTQDAVSENICLCDIHFQQYIREGLSCL